MVVLKIALLYPMKRLIAVTQQERENLVQVLSSEARAPR